MKKRSFLRRNRPCIGASCPCLGAEQGQAAPVLNPAIDLSVPNYAYSPPLRKFVDRLPGLTSGRLEQPRTVHPGRSRGHNDISRLRLLRDRTRRVPRARCIATFRRRHQNARLCTAGQRSTTSFVAPAPLSGTVDPRHEEQAGAHQIHQPASPHGRRRRSSSSRWTPPSWAQG